MMDSIIDNYGRNAGKIWEALDTHGPLTQTKLMKTTGLNEEEFYVAIGWLAKEGKITAKKVMPRKTQIRFRLK